MTLRYGIALAAACMLSCVSVGDYAPVSSYTDLASRAGMRAAVSGRISDTPWQHMIASDTGRDFIEYFDWQGGQTVLYSREKIPTGKPIVVYGTVLPVEGGGKGRKSEERFVEYHILVDRWIPDDHPPKG